nr:hypothetical protein [Tanacetum cinerariifolium]
MKKKDQILFDEEVAKKPQDEINKKEILAGERARLAGMKAQQEKKAKIALIETWHELVERSSKKTEAEVAEGSSKRAGEEIEQENSKRKRMKEEHESEELKKLLTQESSSKRTGDKLDQGRSKKQKWRMTKSKKSLRVPNDGDDVTVDATLLSSKSPTNFDYKIYKEGRKNYFQIIRADDNIWKNQQGLVKVLNWKLFYSCGVYCVTMQNIVYYLQVEKMYPLTRNTLHQMWNDVRLLVDYEVEIAYDLLRLTRRQITEGYVPE